MLVNFMYFSILTF